MTIEVFPDSPISPARISFSYDLSQNDAVPVEESYVKTMTSSSSSTSSTIDFDFCVFRESFDHESSTADELFFNGQILPIEIKRRLPPPPPKPQPPPPPLPPKPPEEKQKSFWRFNRSASLNCGSGYGRTLCPLPLLSRSNSTGSAGKRSTVTSNSKPSFLKHQPSIGSQKQNQPYSSSRPPLKRSSHGFYGNGVKFNPVLHVPSANLFGLGSIFSTGKDRSKKKINGS